MNLRSIISYSSYLVILLSSMLFAAEANFSAATDGCDEDETGTVTINFSEAAYGTLTYDIGGASTANAYGSGYHDYNLSSSTINLSGQVSYDLNLNINNDTRYENPETVVINLTASAGSVTIGSTSTITFTITSEDNPPTVDWYESSNSQVEGNTRTIYISRDEDGSEFGLTGTVDWAITNVSTTSADHSTATSGQVTFTESQDTRSFNYRATGDTFDEPNETFTVALSSNVNCSLGGGANFGHTIEDNDDPPNVSFAEPTSEFAESQGTVTVTVDLDAASGKDGITINYAIDASSTANTDDHTMVAGILSYSAGDQSESFNFDITNDILDESDTETLVMYLTGNNEADLTIGDYGTYTVTITDNDGFPTVSIDATDSGNEAVTNPQVTVTLSTASGRDVTLNYADETVAEGGSATPGTDYTTFTGSLTISAGSLTNDFGITVIDDNINELNQDIIFSIASPDYATLATAQQTYTITNDDAEPFCGFSATSSTVAEGTGGTTTHSVSIVLKDGSGYAITSEKDITFNYAINASDGGTAAGSGTDYTLDAGETTISAGAAGTTIDVVIVGDALYEDPETIILALDPDNGGITNAQDGTMAHTINVQEDDSPPKIQFSAATGNSGDGVEAATSTLTIELDAVSSKSTTVTYNTSDNNAIGGTDYTALTNQTATVAAGSPSTTINLVTLADALNEDNETLFITLTDPGNSSLNTNNVMTFTINDDDPQPSITFGSAAYSNSETTTGPTDIKVNLSAVSGRDVVVGYAIAVGGDATGGGVDYSFTDNAALTINAGVQQITVPLTIINESMYELDQTINFELTAVTNVLAGAAELQATTYTIENDDSQPNVDYKAATSSATENDATQEVILRLSAVSEVDVAVTIINAGGTAVFGTDYTVALEEKTITAGNDELAFDVTLTDDANDEGDETIILGFTGNTNSGAGTNTAHTITLADSDPIPTVGFSNADATGSVQTVIEAVDGTPGSYSIEVILNYPSYQTTRVNYAVNGSSTAVRDEDYTMDDGVLTYSVGDTLETIDFSITDDGKDEYDEDVVIDLTANTNCTVGAIGQLVITIADDDAAPTVRFSAAADAAGTEGDATQTIAVSLDPVSGKDVTIPFTLNNGTSTTTNSGGSADTDLSNATVTITAGNASGNISFDITEDGTYENAENLVLDLGTPGDGLDGVATGALHGTTAFNTHTFVITNSDSPPSVSFLDPNALVTETNATFNATFQVQLSVKSEVDATFYIEDADIGDATEGADYTLATATEVTISAGDLTGTFDIPILGDLTDELDQTFTMTLTTPVSHVALGGQRTQLVTITDNDDPPTISIDTTNSSTNINESIGTGSFIFLLDRASEKDLSIGYVIDMSSNLSASLTQDYTGLLTTGGSVTLQAGRIDTTFSFTVVNDIVDERNQTINLDLSSGTESNVSLSSTLNTHTAIIKDDDDAPEIYFGTSASSDNENNTGTNEIQTLTITMTDSSERPVTIPYAVSDVGDHPATVDTDYTISGASLTIEPGSGTKTADISLTVIGDTKDEYNQTVTVVMGPTSDDITNGSLHPTNETTYTFTITDDDSPPSASISGSGDDLESLAQTLTVTLSSATEKQTSFNWTVDDVTATTDEDYILSIDPLVIAAEELTGTNTVTGIADPLYEGDETFTVTIAADSNASIGTGTATVTLLDDDGKSQLSFESNAIAYGEESGAISLPINLDKASGFDTELTYVITAAGDASDPDDYTIVVSTITILAGQITENISFSLINDNLVEGDETIVFEITEADANGNTNLGGFPTITVTITDDDNPPVDFGIGNLTMAASSDPTKAIKEYWNSFNDGFSVNVPIDLLETNANLNNGSVQLLAKAIGGTYSTLGDPVTINWGAMKGDSLTLSIVEEDFEGHASYAQDSLIVIAARITDVYANFTNGTQSLDTLIIDVEATTKRTVSTFSAAGGVEVLEYFNGTNTSMNVLVPLVDDASLIGGTIQLRSKVTLGNAFVNVGTPYTITGGDINASAAVPAPSADYISLTDFVNGSSIYHTALVVDVAGNEKTFDQSVTTVLIDTTRPVLQSVVTDLNSDYYNLGDTIPFTLAFDDSVASTDNGTTWLAYFNSGSSITGDINTINRLDTLISSYIVQVGDATPDLTVDSIVISNGFIRDKAGNDLSVFTIESGNNISDAKDIKIDGNAPADFQIASVLLFADPTEPVVGAWNSHNTSATIPVTLANDTTLTGGSIQAVGIIGTDTTNIGSAHTILIGDLNSDVIMTLDAADIEAVNGFAEDSNIIFSATVTDLSGNSTKGGESSAILLIDQTLAQDMGIDSVYARAEGDVISVSKYFNSTYNSILGATLVDGEDNSFLNGNVQLQARFESEAEFTSVGLPVPVVQSHLDNGLVPFSSEIDITSFDGLAGVQNDNRIYFRSLLTDSRGNLTTAAEDTVWFVIYDKIPHESVELSYSPSTANSDATVTITATFSETAYGYDQIDQKPHIQIEYGSGLGSVDEPMIFTVDSDSLIWTYEAELPDNEADEGVVTVSVTGTDIAGNPIEAISVTGGTDFEMDNTSPTITYTYSNTTTANDPVHLGTGEEVVTVEALWNEDADMTIPRPDLIATYGDASTDTLAFVNNTDATLWNYTFILPSDPALDGEIALHSTSADIANNFEFIYIRDTTFVLDNTSPLVSNIFPPSSSSVKEGEMQLGYSLTEVTGPIQSGSVTFNAVSGPGTDFSVTLIGEELSDTTHPSGDITEQATITSNLVDSTFYNIVFSSQDFAENLGVDSVTQVKYDISQPFASVSFSSEYASEGMEETLTVNFSEKMLPTPKVILNFGSADLEDLPVTTIEGDMEASGIGDSVWIFPFIIPEGMDNDGMVRVWFGDPDGSSLPLDQAGNSLRSPPILLGSDSVIYSDTLYVDNLIPEATITYDNISDTTLTNIGVGGQAIRLTVSMNELLSLSDPIPSINYWYNDGTAFGDTVVTMIADSNNLEDLKWYFNIVLADGDTNDGDFYATFIAKDRPGNDVESVLNTNVFRVDNIHPAEFGTGTTITLGEIPVEGWFNSNTEHISVKIPIENPSTDSTLYNGGYVDIQLFNITRGTNWQTISLDDPTAQDTIVNPGDSVLFSRKFTNILAALPDGSDMVLGDSIKVRSKITDRHGNSTIGSESTSKFVYDPTAPVVGNANGGNFTLLDTLVSSDTLTIQWTEFIDFGDQETHSGTDRYELAIEKVTDPADSITNLYGWDTVPLPSIPYEIILPLMHNETYVAHIRAIDVAGNISDTLHADTLLRYNSKPNIVQFSQVTLYEDIAWNNIDSITLTDLDLSTVQSDSFTYEIITTRTLGNPATANIAVIDSIGRMSWLPTQNDTGSYEMKVIATDAYSFTDTMAFPLTVVAVNDTPSFAILSPDNSLEWIEDHTDTVKINLTSYIIDVDNNDTTDMTWQAVILDTTQLDEDFPLGQVIVGPGTPWDVHARLTREYIGFNPNSNNTKAPVMSRRTINYINNSRSNPLLTVKIDTAASGEKWAMFDSDSNYYGANHRIIFVVQDPEGAEARDTIMATVLPKNDPPIISSIPFAEVTENDSIRLDFGSYATDVDDSSLTFTVTAITNEDKILISPGTFVSHGFGDSVLFIPEKLWSNETTIQVVVADEEASDTAVFTLDILRVPRPHLSVSVVQNNAFNQFIQVVVTDTMSKVRSISLDIQNEDIALDTIAAYTYSGDFKFANSGTYSIDVLAFGEVGDTTISEAFALAAGRAASRWYGSSDDGRFNVIGHPGAVSYDQPFLIVDSTLFANDFNDQASYVLGDENFAFGKPIEVRIASQRTDLAIYRRKNGVTWEELPSLTLEGSIFTLSRESGYFKLGPKTIIVPEETNIHQNYPNPFNPTTTIMYDIGLMDGLSQNVSISIYNLLGQDVRTLIENQDQIGQFKVQWDGKDKFGQHMASGVYFVQLTTHTGIIKNKKMMLLK